MHTLTAQGTSTAPPPALPSLDVSTHIQVHVQRNAQITYMYMYMYTSIQIHYTIIT